jgi:hypothetical protein
MMKKNSLFVLMMIAIALGLNACACQSFPEKLTYSPGLEQKLDNLEIPIAIVVSKKGEIAAYDKNGDILDQCYVPDKDQKAHRGLKPCPGLDDNRTIVFNKKLKIIGSHGSPYCVTVVDILGRAWTYCVKAP